MTKDLLRTLSRKTQLAVENSPEVEAYRYGSEVVPNTWGGYATKAIDLGLAEPTADSVIALLGGRSIVDLKDPDVLFKNPRNYDSYRHAFQEAAVLRHSADLIIERNRLLQTAQIVIKQWEIDPDEGQKAADDIQEVLNDTPFDVDTTLLCMKRDGMRDGIDVSLGEFATTMFGVNVLDEEAPSELARHWVAGVGSVIDSIYYDYSDTGFIDRTSNVSELPVKDVALNSLLIGRFIGAVSRSHMAQAYVYAEQEWEAIQPIFMPPDSLTVLHGNEH